MSTLLVLDFDQTLCDTRVTLWALPAFRHVASYADFAPWIEQIERMGLGFSQVEGASAFIRTLRKLYDVTPVILSARHWVLEPHTRAWLQLNMPFLGEPPLLLRPPTEPATKRPADSKLDRLRDFRTRYPDWPIILCDDDEDMVQACEQPCDRFFHVNGDWSNVIELTPTSIADRKKNGCVR